MRVFDEVAHGEMNYVCMMDDDVHLLGRVYRVGMG